MKLIMRTVVTAICVLMLGITAFASDIDISSLGDDQLKQLYENVKAEMVTRGLPVSKEITLREGKFIVGEDILPGTYTITCRETDGEKIGDPGASLPVADLNMESDL